MADDAHGSLDPVGDALAELRGIGLLVDRIDFSAPPGGRLVHRVDVEGQKKGKKAGWYRLFEFTTSSGRSMVVGSYGIWVGGEKTKYSLKSRGADLNAEDKVRIREQQKRLAEQAERDDEEAARDVRAKAKGIWEKLVKVDGSAGHYLKRKQVGAYGLAQGRDGVIVVPARNTAGVLTQLQFIAPDGQKRFLTGPGKAGSYHLIGQIADEHPVVFAEGYATGASIHMATGWPVAVCFDANNLVAVGGRLRAVYPNHRFIFAGDDDHEKKRNTGREVVARAASSLKGQAVFPRFLYPTGRTDFNDLHTETEDGLAVVRAQLEQAVTLSTPKAPPGARALDGKWQDRLIYSQKGPLEQMSHNAAVVLTHHQDWRGVFGYNAFAKRIELCRETPYGGQPGWITDNDEIKTAMWFAEPDTFRSNMPTPIVRQAISAVASENSFHPVRDYLDRLHWDGQDRLGTFFVDYCSVLIEAQARYGVEKTLSDEQLQLLQKVWRGFAHNFFIAAVARVFDPGCKADLMLVLEGEQGRRKSTMIEVLAGPGGYADVGQSPSDKDFFQSIQGVWLVEISEMASFARAETSHIKRAISVAVDRFRRSYGHHVEDFKRECLFFGTVNNSEWQRDETGGRRYMPVWVGDIGIEGIRAVRDQLWAEAVHRYRAGESWWVLPEGAQAAQDDRYLDDPWTERIVRWLEGKFESDIPAFKGEKGRKERATASQILAFALELELKKQDRSAQTRVGNVMKRLGWSVERKQKRVGSARLRFYVRPRNDDQPEAGT